MPTKQSINPITIPSAEGYAPLNLTIARLHMQVGAKRIKNTQFIISPRAQDPKSTAEMVFIAVDETQLIDAIGYLFPAGELAATHFTAAVADAVDTKISGVSLGEAAVRIEIADSIIKTHDCNRQLETIPHTQLTFDGRITHLTLRADSLSQLQLLLPVTMLRVKEILAAQK